MAETVRYYMGDAEDLEGLTREEVWDQTCEDYERASRFREFLDDIYEPVTVAGMEFPASRILEDCDPIAWRVMLADEFTEVDPEDYPAADGSDDAN